MIITEVFIAFWTWKEHFDQVLPLETLTTSPKLAMTNDIEPFDVAWIEYPNEKRNPVISRGTMNWKAISNLTRAGGQTWNRWVTGFLSFLLNSTDRLTKSRSSEYEISVQNDVKFADHCAQLGTLVDYLKDSSK